MKRSRAAIVTTVILIVACHPSRARAQDSSATSMGAVVFDRACRSCHDGAAASRAPSPDALRQRAPEAIVDALVAGAMRLQGSRLSGAERRAVAEYVTGRTLGGDVAGATAGRCAATNAAAPFDPSSGPMWNGWGPTAVNTHMQPAVQAGLTAEQVPRLKLKWALGFPDASSAWAQPSIAGGRVFVGSQNGTVYALDAKSGCIYWTFGARGGVRTAMAIGPRRGASGFAIYFGDLNGHVYAVDAATGQQLWVRQVEDHPYGRITGSPTLYQDRLYVPVASLEEAMASNTDYGCCTFRGSLVALDTGTGAVAWQTRTITETLKARGKNEKGLALWGPSGAPIWSAPTVDAKRRVVYASTGNMYTGPQQATSDAVIAFDMSTGAIKWVRQMTPNDIFPCRPSNCIDEGGDDYDFGNSPILATLPNGRDAIVIGQKSGVGWAIDPDKQGAVLWQYRAGQGGSLGGIEWGSAVDAEHAYFPVSDIQRPNPGGLHAVNLLTGERAWYAPPPPPVCASGRGCNGAQSAAISVIPGVVFSGSNDGAIRAYSTRDGSIVWTYDTNRDFETLNHVPAKGASLIGPGPTVAGGMLYVNSGYGAYGGRPGNVLLAFGIE